MQFVNTQHFLLISNAVLSGFSGEEPVLQVMKHYNGGTLQAWRSLYRARENFVRQHYRKSTCSSE